MKKYYFKKRSMLYYILLLGVGIASFSFGRTSVHSQKRDIESIKIDSYHKAEQRKEGFISDFISKEAALEKQIHQNYLRTFDKNAKELALVNKDNPLPDTYEVNLVPITYGKGQIADIAADPLHNMLTDGTNQGLSFFVTSSHRAIERQQELIQEDVNDLINRGLSNEEALKETMRETMPAGHSEHQTGLAVDVIASGTKYLTAEEENTPENVWLRENCANYGFILRYPKDKVGVTKINYEPWHFRYVGVKAAKYMAEHKLTLEEFYDELP